MEIVDVIPLPPGGYTQINECVEDICASVCAAVLLPDISNMASLYCDNFNNQDDPWNKDNLRNEDTPKNQD